MQANKGLAWTHTQFIYAVLVVIFPFAVIAAAINSTAPILIGVVASFTISAVLITKRVNRKLMPVIYIAGAIALLIATFLTAA